MKVFKKKQRIALIVSLALVLISGIATSLLWPARRQQHIGMTLFSLTMYFVFYICAKYPSNAWQMSDKQRISYKTEQEARENYRRIMVTMNLGAAIFMSVLLWTT